MSDAPLFSPAALPLPEPDWHTAPAWAQFWAVDRNGQGEGK